MGDLEKKNILEQIRNILKELGEENIRQELIHCDWQIWQNSENSQIFGFAAFKTNIYYKPQVLSYLLYNIHNKSIKI